MTSKLPYLLHKDTLRSKDNDECEKQIRMNARHACHYVTSWALGEMVLQQEL